MSKSFSAEADNWLIKNHSPSEIIRDLTDRYNLTFGENRSIDTMKHHCRLIGLKQSKRFTEEQDNWLIENAPKLSVAETARQFNMVFGANRTAEVLKVRCNRNLRIFHANKKYALGFPVGSETVLNGYTWVKVADVPYQKDSFYKNWKQKQRIVWEKHNGSLPDGWNVVFLNGDRSNCAIENLYAVDGRTRREMAKKKWWSTNPEITLTAIRWCELFHAIRHEFSEPLNLKGASNEAD